MCTEGHSKVIFAEGSTVIAWFATGMIHGTTTVVGTGGAASVGGGVVGSRVGAALPPRQNSHRLPGSNGGSRHRMAAHAAGSNEEVAVGAAVGANVGASVSDASDAGGAHWSAAWIQI